MPTPLELIDLFDASRIDGAYGPVDEARLKTTLASLFAESPPATDDFINDLEDLGVIHQGMPDWDCWELADLLAACLELPGTEQAGEAVLEFLRTTAWIEDPYQRIDAPAMLAELEPRLVGIDPQLDHWRHAATKENRERLMSVVKFDEARKLISQAQTAFCLPRWVPAVRRYVDDPDPCLMLQAVQLAVGGDPSLVPSLVERTRQRVAARGLPGWQRACAVCALWLLHEDVRPFRSDDSLAVRAVAALAPGMAADDEADRTLIAALRDPDTLDSELAEAGLFTWTPSIYAIPRVLARVGSTTAFGPEDLVDVAIASARHTAVLPANWAWGQYVGPIMADAEPGKPLSAGQRRYLAALADGDDYLWESDNGNNQLVFREAGLPYDRDACVRLADGEPWEPSPGT